METPEDIRLSVPYIKDILHAYNIPIFEVMGFEADDVIGTMSKLAYNEGFTTYMMTPDKDYMQLVNEHTLVYKPARSGGSAEILDVNYVTSLYNITSPEQIIDILSLWGDASDNVPGVPGIGEKTAAGLISKYGSVENIYQHIDELKGKQKENLESFREQLMQNLNLIKIVRDVPLNIDFNKLVVNDIDKEKLLAIFQELEFKTLTNRIIGEVASPKPVTKESTQMSLFDEAPPVNPNAINLKTIEEVDHKYHLVEKAEERKNLIKMLEEQSEFCFDTETTGLDPLQAELVGMSFCCKKGEAYYVPVTDNQQEARKLVEEFKALFEDTRIRKRSEY